MKVFSIDFRENSIGRESLGSPILYSHRSAGRLVEHSLPGGYEQPEQLAGLVQDLHCVLQRSLTGAGEWQLLVFLDQTTNSPPGRGSLNHQLRVIRKEILTPLREQYNQQPALCLGILVDEWKRRKVQSPGSSKTVHAPTNVSAYAHWCSDVFGVLYPSPDPLSFAVDLEHDRYSHLLTENDLGSLNSILFREDLGKTDQPIQKLPEKALRRVEKSASSLIDRVHDIIEEKKHSVDLSSKEEIQGLKTLPPCLDPAKYDQVLGQFEDWVQRMIEGNVQSYLSFSPEEALRKAARNHLSIHGLLSHDNGLALLRLPVQKAPVQRQRKDLLKIDYLTAGLTSISDLGELRQRFVDPNDDSRAYLLGNENSSGKAGLQLPHPLEADDTGVSVDFDVLGHAAQRYRRQLESADSLLRKRRSETRRFEVDLFEEGFEAPCTIELPDEWEDVLNQLDEIPVIRAPHSSPESIWTEWVNAVDRSIERGHQSIRQDLTTCLSSARTEWKNMPTRTIPGNSIDAEIEERRRTFRRLRESVFESSQGSFESNWKARSRDIRERMLRILRVRPRWQQVLWSIFGLVVACIPFLLVSPWSPMSPSTLFWMVLTATGLSIVWMTSMNSIRGELKRRIREARTQAEVVFGELRSHAEDRRKTIQKYFEALAAKENLQLVLDKKREITGTRLRLDHHLEALREHTGDAEALQTLSGHSNVSSIHFDTDPDVDLPSLSSPIEDCSIYSLKTDDYEDVTIFGIEVQTEMLPGLRNIKCRKDPAYDPDSVNDLPG